MGNIRHNTLIATSWFADAVTALAAYAESLGCEVLRGRKAMNGYLTVCIAPDGSNEGWEGSNNGETRREQVKAWLAANSDCCFEWCEVAYGSFDANAVVTDSAWMGVSTMPSASSPASGESLFTAISHTQRNNYQSDFGSIDAFNDWCVKTKPIWAHLFDIATAQRVATYTIDTHGLSASESEDKGVAEPSNTEKALAYYRSGAKHDAPTYVPARVRLPVRVCGDGECAATFADAGEHDCESNRWGAISVRATDGKMLGVKPAEFDVVSWRFNT